MKWLYKQMNRRFGLSKCTVDGKVDYNGCRISQDAEGNITHSMETYLRNINSIDITRARSKQYNEKATEDELSEYRKLTGALMWIGKATLPQESLTRSPMQQQIGAVPPRCELRLF